MSISPRDVGVVLFAACGVFLAFRVGPRVSRMVWFALLLGGITNALVLNLQSYNLIHSNLSHYYLGAKYSFSYRDFYKLINAALEKPQIGMTDLSAPPRLIRATPAEQRAYYIDLLREEGTPFDPYAPLATLAEIGRTSGAVRREAQQILNRGLPGKQIEDFRRDVTYATSAWPGRELTRDFGFNGSPFYTLLRQVDPTLHRSYGPATALLNLGWQIIGMLAFVWITGVALGMDLNGRLAMAALVFASWDFVAFAFPGLVCAGLFLPLAAALLAFKRRQHVRVGVAIAWAGLLKLFPFVLLLPALARLLRAAAFARWNRERDSSRMWWPLLASCSVATAALACAAAFGAHSWADFFGKILPQFGSAGGAGNNVSVSRFLSVFGIGGFIVPTCYSLVALVMLTTMFLYGNDKDFHDALPRRCLVLFGAVGWVVQNWLNYYSIAVLMLLPLVARKHRLGGPVPAIAMALSVSLPDFDDPRLSHHPGWLGLKLAPYVMVPAWLVFVELRPVLSRRAMRIAVFTCALLVLATATEAWREATVKRLGSAAYERVTRGDASGALVMYRKLMRLSPRSGAAKNGQAVALAMLGDSRGSELSFARALQLEPKDAGVRQNHARLLTQVGNTEDAAHELETARELAPYDATILFDLASVRLLQGRGSDAVVLLNRAHELQPENRRIAELWSLQQVKARP